LSEGISGSGDFKKVGDIIVNDRTTTSTTTTTTAAAAEHDSWGM